MVGPAKKVWNKDGCEIVDVTGFMIDEVVFIGGKGEKFIRHERPVTRVARFFCGCCFKSRIPDSDEELFFDLDEDEDELDDSNDEDECCVDSGMDAFSPSTKVSAAEKKFWLDPGSLPCYRSLGLFLASDCLRQFRL